MTIPTSSDRRPSACHSAPGAPADDPRLTDDPRACWVELAGSGRGSPPERIPWYADTWVWVFAILAILLGAVLATILYESWTGLPFWCWPSSSLELP